MSDIRGGIAFGDAYLGAGGGAAMPRENGKVRGER